MTNEWDKVFPQYKSVNHKKVTFLNKTSHSHSFGSGFFLYYTKGCFRVFQMY